MTREEALTEWVMPAIRRTWNEKKCDEILKALDQEPCDAVSRKAAIDACLKGLNRKEMAANIKALPSVQPECTEDYCPAAFKPTECEDCISLEAVKNTMFMVQRTAFISDNEFHRTMDLLMRLPSVTPAEKVGRWIYIGNSEVNGLKICKCSNCKKKTYGSHKFCPNCGAKMQEVDE